MRIALAMLSIALVVPAVSAMDISVNIIDAKMMANIYMSPPDQAKWFVSDTTVLANLSGLPVEIADKLPVASNVIFYFAPDGGLLAWSNKSDTVKAGTWVLKPAPNANAVCLTLAEAPDAEVCTSPDLANSYSIKESTEHNPFRLVAGAPVPMTIPLEEPKLSDIAQKID